MDWRISRALANRMLAEGTASNDAEICGLLFGEPGSIGEARSCLNVAPDPSGHFEIDPAALIAAHKAERAGGPKLVGCYHSHPNGATSPSGADAAAGFSGLWIIVAGGELHAWEADVAGRFLAAPLLFS